ncbi:MAG: hypothetical protein NVS2B12_09350 [Ktedonobacteraceae bacterium]
MAMGVKDRTAKKPHTNAQAPRTPRSIRTSRTPPLTFARYSVPHEKHPEQNEDTILIDRERGLAGVFDGVGSGPGRIASRLAARVIRRGWRDMLQEAELLSAETQLDVSEFLQFLMQDAHVQIRAAGERLARKSEQKIVHPGTTAVLAAFHRSAVQQGGYTLSYAHVGDSRIYLWRPNESLTRLTADDGYLSLRISDGSVSESDALRIDQATSPDQLSAIERDYFERRNGITQALGSEKQPSMHVNSAQILPGDRVLLCSDGIHDNLTDSELADLLRREARTVVARKIVQQAIECSHQESDLAIRAKLDDMSAVVVTCNF